MIYEPLSNNLKELRLKKELTQKEVADYLNVDRSTYSYYEARKTEPSLTTLAKLCELFEVDFNTILKR